ncbi:hypothetical protein TGPRC2_232780 [Toxoplasma gondii TgCatPRC2]|uniref:Uncharacterized protein n=1 Tax=Toxoplasma gondii TgCatPRC2 TaxID=1130821 RepID=A0A151H2K1_TOXGO|nr:hypothetical protein TGPRC2_232780 [Toxoplasma gondii TgCatPRC2]
MADSRLPSPAYPATQYSCVGGPYSPTHQGYVVNGQTPTATTESTVIHRISSSSDRVLTLPAPFPSHMIAVTHPTGETLGSGSELGYHAPPSRYSPTRSAYASGVHYTSQGTSATFLGGGASQTPSATHNAHSAEERADAGGPQSSSPGRSYYFETFSSDAPQVHLPQASASRSRYTRGTVASTSIRQPAEYSNLRSSENNSALTPYLQAHADSSPHSSNSHAVHSLNQSHAAGRGPPRAGGGEQEWNGPHNASSYNSGPEAGFHTDRRETILQNSAAEHRTGINKQEHEVLGGHRQSAALLPVFVKDGEMIDHGKRFGGEQPEVSRHCNQRGSHSISFWSDDEDETNGFSRLKHREPTDLEGWRELARQIGVENKMLRGRIKNYEKQIFTLQQQVDRETARADAQTKNQMTMEADVRTAREELLRLRHTLRMNQRGAELTRGAVIGGGAADCSREVFLLREALAEAAEYHMQLLQQNDTLRVHVEWLRRNEAHEGPSGCKNADKARLDAQLEGHERRELKQLRDLFSRLQSAADESAGYPDAMSLETFIGQQEGGGAADRFPRINPSAGRRHTGSISGSVSGHGTNADSNNRIFVERSTSGETAQLGTVLMANRGAYEENCDARLPSGTLTGSLKQDVEGTKAGALPRRMPSDGDRDAQDSDRWGDDTKGPIKRLEQRIREYQSKAPGATATAGEASPRHFVTGRRDRGVSDK